MDAIDFVRNIYKGENIAECENHLESFLKKKVQELIPEHLAAMARFKRIAEAQEDCSNANDGDDDDDDDDDIDESLPDDVKDKIVAALKSIKGYKKLSAFEVHKNKEACVAAKFKVDDDTRDEDITAYKSKITKALAKEGLKKVEFVVNDNDDDDEINFDVLA